MMALILQNWQKFVKTKILKSMVSYQKRMELLPMKFLQKLLVMELMLKLNLVDTNYQAKKLLSKSMICSKASSQTDAEILKGKFKLCKD